MPSATKRSGEAVSAGTAKRSKAGAADRRCAVIEEALRLAKLHPGAVEVLLGALPHSLGVAREERHPFQEEAVAMLGGVIGDREASLAQAAGAAQDRVAEAECRKQESEAAVSASQAELDARRGLSHERKRALAADAQVFQQTKAVLAEAEDAMQRHGHELRSAQRLIDEAAVLAKFMEHLHEDPEKISDFLASLERHITVDDSLRTAIPCTFAKDLASRGRFDNLVTQQLTERLSARAAERQAQLDRGDAVAAERSATFEAARAAMAAAKERQMASARAYMEAAELTHHAEEASRNAKKDLAQAQKLLKAAAVDLANAQVDHELFCQDVVVAFNELRDRSLPSKMSVPEMEATDTAAHVEPEVVTVA